MGVFFTYLHPFQCNVIRSHQELSDAELFVLFSDSQTNKQTHSDAVNTSRFLHTLNGHTAGYKNGNVVS
jgi:hypothetical protein